MLWYGFVKGYSVESVLCLPRTHNMASFINVSTVTSAQISLQTRPLNSTPIPVVFCPRFKLSTAIPSFVWLGKKEVLKVDLWLLVVGFKGLLCPILHSWNGILP